MQTTTIPDYSAPLAGAPRQIDKLTAALAIGNRPRAREIVNDLRARLDTVIAWIDREDGAAQAKAPSRPWPWPVDSQVED